MAIYRPGLRDLPDPPPGRTGWPWTEGRQQLSDRRPEGSLWPRVSIVTPSYNQADFLEMTIRSVVLQDYPNLEYIIVDGGSTDGSVDIIRKYEPWITRWVSEEDQGQSHAINKGWRWAKGTILAWLNSDDIYEPGAIEKAVRFLQEHPETGMLYGDCNIIDEDGKVIERCPTRRFDLEALVCNEWFIAQPAVFVRKEVIDRVGDLNEDLHLVMDWELWLRIAMAGVKIRYLQQGIANFRTWASAKTRSQSERSGREKLEVLDSLFSSPQLAEHLYSIRRKAYSNVHRFIALNHYAQDDMSQARRHILKAVTLYPPWLLEDWRMTKMFLVSLLGKATVTRLRSWKAAWQDSRSK